MRYLRWLPVACLLIGALAWEGGRTAKPARGDDPAAPKSDTSKSDAAKHVYRILMLTQSGSYEHKSVKREDGKLSTAERTLTDLGISSGLFHVDCSQDAAKDFTKEKLANYDLVFFYTQSQSAPDPKTGQYTKILPFSKESLDYFFNDWLKQKGHGFIGTHSAADTLHENPAYRDMLGAEFRTHPWGNGSKVIVTVHDTKHPAMKPWGDEFEIADEIYAFKNWHPENVRVLMSLNMEKTAHKEPYHVPVAWCRDWGEGKVFYISLGHDESVWRNPKYQQSLLGAIKWELNLEPGDATPNPEVSKAQQKQAEEAYAADPNKKPPL